METTPRISLEKLFSYKRAYMGISIENPTFQGEHLEALLSWMKEKFGECLVILGDYLWRYNEQIFSGISSEEAGKKSLGMGDDFLQKNQNVIEEKEGESLVLRRWQVLLETERFKEEREKLAKLFNSNEDFQGSIEKDAFSFVKRQVKRDKAFAVSTERAIELSSSYLLEEIAVFSVLSSEGWNVELYPGPELKVLVDISKGKYRDIPEGLKKRINVELGVDKNFG